MVTDAVGIGGSALAEILRIASQISTPLGLAGLLAGVFLILARSKVKTPVLVFAFTLDFAAIGLAFAGFWIDRSPELLGYSGSVRRADTRVPVKGATVELGGIPSVAPQETDSAGLFDFEIPAKAQGSQTVVRVSRSGFEEWTGRRRLEEPLPPENVHLELVAAIAGPSAPTQPASPAGPGSEVHTSVSAAARSAAIIAGRAAASPVMARHVAVPTPAAIAIVARPGSTAALAVSRLPTVQTGWVYYGEFDGSRWGELFFRQASGDEAAYPRKGDSVVATSDVTVREGPIKYQLFKGWQNRKLLGFLGAGDRVRVDDVKKVAGKRVWIKFTTG